MRLEIRSFADAGNLEKERLILRVSSDTDIGEYAVLRSGTGSSGSPTSGRKMAYWFPDVNVNAGDIVVLYSKKGTRSEKPLTEGRTAHFFYWGSSTPLWVPGRCAVVLLVSDWEYKLPT